MAVPAEGGMVQVVCRGRGRGRGEGGWGQSTVHREALVTKTPRSQASGVPRWSPTVAEDDSEVPTAFANSSRTDDGSNAPESPEATRHHGREQGLAVRIQAGPFELLPLVKGRCLLSVSS